VFEFFPEDQQVAQPLVLVGLFLQQLVFYGQRSDTFFLSDVFIVQPDRVDIVGPGAAHGIDACICYAQGK
jgi:hypothetical protein